MVPQLSVKRQVERWAESNLPHLGERKQVRWDCCLTLQKRLAHNPPMSLRVHSASTLWFVLFLRNLSDDMNTANTIAKYTAKSSATQTGCCDILLLISINFLTLQSSHMQKSSKFSWPLGHIWAAALYWNLYWNTEVFVVYLL